MDETYRVREVTDPRSLAESFRHVAEMAGTALADTDIVVQALPAPHRPPTALPLGWMAVYVFCYRGAALKIGQAGPNRSPRYTQDYSAAMSSGTLAARLLSLRDEMRIDGFTEDSVAEWISTNTSRLNFLIRSKVDIRILSLLKSFLECRLQPDVRRLCIPRDALP